MNKSIKRKAIVVLAVAAVFGATLIGCGNMSIGFGNFTFDKVHVDTYHNNCCFTIEKWYDNKTGIEVKTKEAGSMYLSEGQYMLIEGDCPFCAAKDTEAEEQADENIETLID